jgi:hypothetical protein
MAKAEVELDLLENAIDSLNEALTKYQNGKAGDEKAYKFCVQHLSHFLELILKYYVTQSHSLLIYKNPFAKSIHEESHTIGLHDAINFLKNEGHSISKKFEEDIKWLKKLRNNIEHHKFSMDITKIEETIGRIISAVVDFDEAYKNIDLSTYIKVDQYNLFIELAYTYESRLKKAKLEVKEALSGLDPTIEDQAVYHCDECDHDTIIPNEDSDTGYKCTFCGNEESDDIEVNCGMCDLQWPIWQMSFVDWADTGIYEYFCPYCCHDPEYINDN